MMVLVLIFSLFASAEVEKSQDEILKMTGLTPAQILQKTQESLEQYLFQDDSGESCGLDEFAVSHYLVPNKAQTYERFTVVTDTTGPVGHCDGYATYNCFTEWSNKSGSWNTVSTECEDGYEFND